MSVAAIGLPVNGLADYVLLTVLAVIVFSGEVSAQWRRWFAAFAIVAISIAGQSLLAPPRIEEGHNIFLPGAPGNALQAALPADVYQAMRTEFDAHYPPARRCQPNAAECWERSNIPGRAFAFSADSVFHKSEFSRSVTGLSFSDPVRLRLGFINENQYNWSKSQYEFERGERDRRFWMGLQRWQITMPWFEVIRLPAAMAGGELCWRGKILWEGEGGRFAALPGENCRAIANSDAGRRVYGLAIKPNSLSMNLVPPVGVRLLQFAQSALTLIAAFGVLIALVRWRPRKTFLPLAVIGLSLIVIALGDASFIGGVRPFDGGDDGLFYDGVGRTILQKFLAGDIYGALEGGEKVFFYGGPGLRYFRALEHVIFGESYLGYLSLVLVLPFAAYFLFRRFLPERWALALIILFVAIPVGELFGTSFYHYAKWAARGFADPAAYVFFICGLLPVIGTAPHGPDKRFTPAFFGALLMALAIFMKPIVAPAVAVILGGAGLASLASRQWPRFAGMCIGFLPVFSMALHNWVYGGVFVLFSANAGHPDVLVMSPTAYASVLRELLALAPGEYVLRAMLHALRWLAGPSEFVVMAPFNAAAITVLVYVVASSRFDSWLRLIGAAALAQHAVALFYISTPRYHYLTWFLTMLVAVVWVRQTGIGWLQSRHPDFCARAAAHPLAVRLASGLARMQKIAA